MLKCTPDNILLRLRYEIVSADTITYVKVSGGHFELEGSSLLSFVLIGVHVLLMLFAFIYI
jgi:hypothetical protein